MSKIEDTVNRAKKSKSMLKKQRIAIIILVCAVLLLSAVLITVNKIVKDLPIEFTDPNDGTVYHIKKISGNYALCPKDSETPLSKTEDGYYITDSGALVYVDPSTGEYYLDSGRELIYPQLSYNVYSASGTSSLPKDQIIDRLDVTNEFGSYSFLRKKLNTFELVGHETVTYSQEAFAYLMSACGYTLSTIKLENPKTLPDGSIDWAEYGLAAEQRVKTETDEDGNITETTYDYTPATATITTASGKTYTLYIGDPTVTGNSYYARYAPKNSVFVLAASGIGDYLLQPIESVISPAIVYQMGSTDYVCVEDFKLYNKIDYAAIEQALKDKFGDTQNGIMTGTQEEYDAYYSEMFELYSEKICHFSFQDMDARTNSIYANLPYISHLGYSDGYYINGTNISFMLQDLYQTDFVKTEKLGPTDGELEKFGLLQPKYVLSYYYPTVNEEGKEIKVFNKVYISEQNKDGTYYAYSDTYDMVVCVSESSFEFLAWNEFDWYDPAYMQHSIGHVTDIIIEAPDTNIHFSTDDSQTLDGNFFPITKTEFEGLDGKKFNISEIDGKYVLVQDKTTLTPVGNRDFLVTGLPYQEGTAQGDGFLLAESEGLDSNNDGNNDGYVYYYYNISPDGLLYATMVITDTNGNQVVQPENIPGTVAYSTDYFITDGVGKYVFLLPKDSTAGAELSQTYEKYGKGTWYKGNVFITAKGSYVLVNADYKAGDESRWAVVSSASNNVYVADKTSSKLFANSIEITAFGVRERIYSLSSGFISFDSSANKISLYDKEKGTTTTATKTDCAPGIWFTADFYTTPDGTTLVIDPNTGDAGTIQMTDNSPYVGYIYANGKELNYTFNSTDIIGNAQQKLAIYNFQQFYMGLVYGSMEGVCELSEEEMAALRELDNFSDTSEGNPCMLKMTVFIEDIKGNTRYLVYRVYRFSERRAYLTIESLDSPDAESSSQNAYGKFYILSSFAQKLISDANKVVNGEEVIPTSKY
ncbi:MAG: DUF4340 domain-containing protein [Ruminococcaceae bacterium]|nr:DUF4340 domain-containing protein [Oscillospiraceae bacterium]